MIYVTTFSKKADINKQKVTAIKLLDFACYIEKGFRYDYSTAKRTQKGKPYRDGNDFYFNVSHCPYSVAVAIADYPIGIDVAEIQTINNVAKNKIFSEKELSIASSDRDFTYLWAVKESFFKCIGTGINHNMYKNDFSCVFNKTIGEFENKYFLVKEYDGFILSVFCDKKINGNVIYVSDIDLV